MKDKLIARLPKKYRGRVKDLEPAADLIDGCRYLLSFNWPFAWEDYWCVPVRSVTEAIQFVKEANISDYEIDQMFN